MHMNPVQHLPGCDFTAPPPPIYQPYIILPRLSAGDEILIDSAKCFMAHP